MSKFKQLGPRIWGALIYGIGMVTLFYFNWWTFSIASAILLFLAIPEASKMLKIYGQERLPQYLGVGFLFIFLIFSAFHIIGLHFFYIKWLMIVGAAYYLLWFVFIFSLKDQGFQNLDWSLLMILYLGIGFTSLWTYTLPLFDYNPAPVFNVLFCVWAADIGAYFTGSLFGKTKFSSISPNKSVEGILGGLVFSILISIIMIYFTNFSISKAVGLGIIISITSLMGDLVQSRLKRVSGLKDSGQLIPGHGGILDRIDGYLYVQPFVALYLNYVT